MSPGTLLLGLRWACLVTLLAGCAGMDSLSEDGLNLGGQTGSLKPPTCEEESANPFVVPEGRTALVEGWHELANPMLRDAAGNLIATSTTESGNAAVIQTDEPLLAGDYTVTYACGDGGTLVERDINVAEAAPLPTEFGELELAMPSAIVDCSELPFITLKWSPPPEFLPYLDLTQLTFAVGGVAAGSIPLTAPLSSDLEGNVLVNVPNCAHFHGTCGPPDGVYSLHARVAARSEQWVSDTVQVNDICFTRYENREQSGCSLIASRRHSPRGWAWAVAFAVAAIVTRRYPSRCADKSL